MLTLSAAIMLILVFILLFKYTGTTANANCNTDIYMNTSIDTSIIETLLGIWMLRANKIQS